MLTREDAETRRSARNYRGRATAQRFRSTGSTLNPSSSSPHLRTVDSRIMGRAGRIVGTSAHIVFGTVLAPQACLFGVDLCMGSAWWYELGLDTCKWWWIPFCAIGLSMTLLTIRPRDQRRFWIVLPSIYILCSVVVLVQHLP